MRSTSSPCAVSIITGIADFARICRNASNPRTPGSITSRITREYVSESARATPVVPSCTASTSNPCERRYWSTSSQSSTSSSTTRIRVAGQSLGFSFFAGNTLCLNLISRHNMPPQMNIDVRFELPTLASHLRLLHEPHIRWLAAALGGLLDRSELRFMARDILPQGPPNPLRVPGAYDDAGKQLSLRPIREDVNEIQSELLQIVVQHHQIAVLSLQFLFVRLDLHLPWDCPLLFHLLLPIVVASCTARSKVPQRFLFCSTAPGILRALGSIVRKRSARVLLTKSFVKSSLGMTFTVVNRFSVTEYQLKESWRPRSLPNSTPNRQSAAHLPRSLLPRLPGQAQRACPLCPNPIAAFPSLTPPPGFAKSSRLPAPATLWQLATWTPATGPPTSAADRNSGTRCSASFSSAI